MPQHPNSVESRFLLTLCRTTLTFSGTGYAQLASMWLYRMVQRPYNQRSAARRAFTLIEVLLVCAIITILGALFLGAAAKAKLKAQRIACISNLREIGTSYAIFAHEIEHQGEFPVRVSTNRGGAWEFVPHQQAIAEVYQAFSAVANELSTPLLTHCPSDPLPASRSFAAFDNGNISYFVGTLATPSQPGMVTAGDRNVLVSSNNYIWGPDLHQFKGNLLFADAHVEQRSSWPFLLATTSPGPGSSGNALAPTAPPAASQPSPPSGASGAQALPSAAPQRPGTPHPSTPASTPSSSSRNSAVATAGYDDQIYSTPTGNQSKPHDDPPPHRQPSPSTVSQSDDEPDSPMVKFFANLIGVGFYVSLLWVVLMLLLLLWKKLRDRRLAQEDAAEMMPDDEQF